LERRETPAPVATVPPLSAANHSSNSQGVLIKGEEVVAFAPPVKLASGAGVSLSGNATGSATGLGSFSGKVVASIAYDFRSFSFQQTFQAANGDKLYAAIQGHYKHRTNTFSAKGGATTDIFVIYGGTGEFAHAKGFGNARISPISHGDYPFNRATIAFKGKVHF
jgi:hypothetical protein